MGGNEQRGSAVTVIAVMYPLAEAADFNEGYYMQTHIPLVRRLWEPLGLSDLTVLRGAPAPDGAAPAFRVIALLTFASIDQFKAAAGQHGKEIFADIPNFTRAQPTIQFSEVVR